MTRSIQDIAPLLADQFVDTENDLTLIKSNQKLLADNAQRLGLYRKYLGLLHDSWFLKTNISADKFSMTLNDFTTHVFADALVKKKNLKIDHDKLVFPIQLDFGITNLTFYSVDTDGNIQSIAPTTVDEYLNEQIISVDNENIDLGLLVWKNNANKPGQHILILLSAKNILLTELQDNAWKIIFGNTYDHYYKYFKSQLETGKYLSDQSVCEELVDECDRIQLT